MTAVEKNYREISRIISRQGKRKFFRQLLKGFCLSAGIFLLGGLIAALFDAIFYFDPEVRLLLVWGIILITTGFLMIHVVKPAYDFWRVKGNYSVETIAREIGSTFNELHDDLLNAVQVYGTVRKNDEKYSLELTGHALNSVLRILKNVQLSRLYPVRALKKVFRFLLSPVLVSVLVLGIFPTQFQESLTHLFHPTVQFKPTPVKEIILKPGDVTKIEGDSCQITAKIIGTYSGPVLLALQQKSRDVPDKKQVMPDSDNVYRYTVRNLRTSLKYSIKAAKKTSAAYSIQVEKRPFAKKLKIRLDYPGYTGLPFRYLEDNVGDVTALVGTRVTLKLNSNKKLAKGNLIFGNGTKRTLKVSGDRARGGFTIRRDGSYRLVLTDLFGYANLEPIRYEIKALEDQFPIVDITIPGKDVDLTEEMKLPLTIEAEDDFGFTRLRLGYRVESNTAYAGQTDTTYHFIPLNFENSQETKILTEYLWNLGDLSMMPEDLVYYFVEVWDNDTFSGPKRSISPVYTARFPSVYEIYQETAQSDDENIDKLKEVLDESKGLKEKLDEISRELLQQQKVDWLKKQDIEDIAKKQQDLQKSVDEVRQELEKMVERLEKNQMLSMETLKKFQELQNLFHEIMTPELQKALEKLQKAAEKLDQNQMKQALRQLQISQDNLLKNLERTINLFKRLQLEQKIDQATKMTENLAQRQEMLNKELKKANPNKLANLLRQQQKVEDDAKSLKDLLSNLDQSLQKEAQFNSPAMDSLLQEIKKAMGKMQQTRQNIQQGKKQQASKSGQMSEQDLRNMLQQLQKLKKEFNQKQKQEFTKEFNRASGDLLRLSQDQEKLMRQTQNMSSSSPQMGQAAESQQQQQQQLGRIADQLYQLSQKTFFVTPEIGQALGKTMNSMQRALQQLEQRNSRAAAGQQAMALGGLNETIMQVQQAMQNMQGSSSGMGFEEFMKRLEQMTGKQQGINRQTMQLGMQPGQGQMTMQQQAAMARLAAEQEALRKSMEQLRKEFGNRSEITGRMEGITKEMEKVVKDLARKKVNPTTINRQKRILSRLLDAQRSMNKRDFSKQRESKPGKTYFVRSPKQIDEQVRKQKERFLDDLIRARKIGFNSDYLELIRNYFQALSEQTKEK